MKTLILSFALGTAALVFASDNPKLAGKWQIHSSIAGNDYDMVCTFTQKDDALGGSCVSDQGTVEIAGKIAGDKVSWSYKSEYQGMPLTVSYSGSVDAENKIKGSVEVPEFGVGGDFAAVAAN
jgi:hypothetical protein